MEYNLIRSVEGGSLLGAEETTMTLSPNTVIVPSTEKLSLTSGFAGFIERDRSDILIIPDYSHFK
jgi:hypothetical protein